MNKFNNIIDSIREFSFDIIGLILLGFIAISLFSLTVNLSQFKLLQIPNIHNEYIATLIVVYSYVLGYILYGLTLINLKCRKFFYNKHYLDIKITNSDIFKQTREKYNSLNPNTTLDIEDLRELRTRIMSYIPESDSKIYIFKFRSDLCEIISLVFILYGILGLASCLINKICNQTTIMNCSREYVVVYILLVLMALSLSLAKDRFYDISMRIPLSVYLSKKINQIC